MELSAEIRQLAQSLAAHGNAELAPSHIARLLQTLTVPQRVAVTHALQVEATGRLDQTPIEACGYARLAHELTHASQDARGSAETALTLAIALNRLGEFREARRFAEHAATFFEQAGDAQNAARALGASAWACTFTGDLSQALAHIARARDLTASAVELARCDWIQARVLRFQANYAEAAAIFDQVRAVFAAAELPLEAARCELELANTHIMGKRGQASPLLEHARGILKAAGCLLDAALCDYLIGVNFQETDHSSQAIGILTSARQTFVGEKAGLFAAWCDMMMGVAYRHLNRYDDALKALHQARDNFLARGSRSDLSSCDLNLGNVYYVLNRYDEALKLYQEAADLSEAEGRAARAARLYTNMGLVHMKQGRFSQALDLHHRALQIFISKGLAALAAASHASLAACYRHLGQYDQALAHLRAPETLSFADRGEYGVAHRIDLAEVHLARGDVPEAVNYLEQARTMAATDALDSFIAVCDRLLAQVNAPSVGREQSLMQIENARQLFLKHRQKVDAALCDLTEGELRLEWNDTAAAEDCFQRARAVLSPAFPDHAWRTDYGLARCAAAVRQDAVALDHYLHAVRTIATSRSMLVNEQISNDFFAHRQSVFDEALALALRQGAFEWGLDVIEASKSRTFLTLLQNRDSRIPLDHADPYVADLITRERSLRVQLNGLHERVAVRAGPQFGEALRGIHATEAISDAELDELNAISQAYEAVVSQLRLVGTGLSGISIPAPFSLGEFRKAANTAFGSDWTALDYYLSADTLTVLRVGPNGVEAPCKTLSPYDRAILDKCTSAEPQSRELIYRGTLHGMAASTPHIQYLRHLYRLLIPEHASQTLIISPHGSLHGLPFHALVTPSADAFLVERHQVLYTPNLQALQLLLNVPTREGIGSPLVFGVSDFQGQMPSLPTTALEVAQVRQAFGGRGEFWCENDASRKRLFDLDASGELRKFDVLHFATHAVLDGTAPHQSRVLLADEALTAMDILDLTLDARLVTLSACQTALGAGGRGDELIGLARVFFYAGARALLATLWHVDDQAMAELTGRFYCHLVEEQNAAVALRQAQSEMIREGHPPYHWAPFVLIGRA